MRSARAAAMVTWAYVLMFGLPAAPVAIFLGDRGQLPSLWGLFDMYGGPWSASRPDGEVVALLLGYLVLTVAAAVSGWLLWTGHRSGALLNLLLLPVEAFFWVGFALPLPWVLGLARIVLVVRAWPTLGDATGAGAGAPRRSALDSFDRHAAAHSSED